MKVTDTVQTFQLDYDAFDGPNSLCIHVVETAEATVQFGTGHESTANEALEITRSNDVDVVIPEHGDIDHYGGIPTLQKELENPPEVAIPEGDEKELIEAGIEPDYSLEDGTVYWGIEAIEVPGHTPGNMAFIFENTLIAGDTVVGADFPPIAVDDWSGAFGIVPASRNTGGDEAAQESVRRLLDYEFETVLVTHGENVLERGGDEIQALVRDLDDEIERTEF